MNSLKGGSKNNLPSLLFFLSFLLLSQTLANSFDRIRQIQASKAKKDSGKRVLVFYFPQYHEIEENNKAWGKGFTDFTNVAKVHRAAHGHPIIRPSERNGFYDLTDEHQRKFQGELARKYGIYGFVYMHYWFSNGPVMDKPLQLMLKDGHPSVHFCLMWANEHWTKRWDGLDGSEVYLKQTYKSNSWDAHWKWLLQFFRHEKYILVDNKPLLLLYRASDIPSLQALLKRWRVLALRAGFDGLHVIQMNGVKWTADALKQQPGVDGVVEYYPNLYNGPQWPVNEVVSSPKNGDVHYYGAHCGWDNTPRHATDGKYSFRIGHPSVYKYVLRQNLARTKPGGFVFVNAWNEWGEGASIEPSLQWGRRWLEATRDAILEEARGEFATLRPNGFAASVPLRRAGVSTPKERQIGGQGGNVCIIVRTHQDHISGQHNLYQLLSSLQSMEYRNWQAFVSRVDDKPFPDLPHVIADIHDDRIHGVDLPANFLEGFSWRNAGYKATDELIKRHCSSKEFDWFMVTNGDNFYAPDALNYLPSEYDIVLMNFYGRYTAINEVLGTNAIVAGMPLENCCVRFNDLRCTHAAPKVSYSDLGGIIFNAPKYRAEGWNFEHYDGHCKTSCHDGALLEDLVRAGWKYTSHPVDVCALYHNTNPVSCRMLGGTYFDSLDIMKAGCYDMADIQEQPVSALRHINYFNFMQSKGSCICEGYDAKQM